MGWPPQDAETLTTAVVKCQSGQGWLVTGSTRWKSRHLNKLQVGTVGELRRFSQLRQQAAGFVCYTLTISTLPGAPFPVFPPVLVF